MKPSLLISMFLVVAMSQAQAAETAAAPPLVSDAATGVARAAFDSIRRFYRQGGMGLPGELLPSKEHPVRIVFSASEGASAQLDITYRSAKVSGAVDIAARNVTVAIDDPATPAERARNPDVYVQVVAGKFRVKSGKYECAGIFSVNGKRLSISGGEAEITGIDGPVRFSPGTQATIDDRSYTYRQGKWSQ